MRYIRGDKNIIINAKVSLIKESENGSLEILLRHIDYNHLCEETEKEVYVTIPHELRGEFELNISIGSYASFVCSLEGEKNVALNFIQFGLVPYSYNKENKEIKETLFVGLIGNIQKFPIGNGVCKISFPINERNSYQEITTWYNLQAWNNETKLADRLFSLFDKGDIGAFICSNVEINTHTTRTKKVRTTLDCNIKCYELLKKNK